MILHMQYFEDLMKINMGQQGLIYRKKNNKKLHIKGMISNSKIHFNNHKSNHNMEWYERSKIFSK